MKNISAYGPVVETRVRSFLNAKKAEAVADSWREDFIVKLLPFATAGKLLRGSLVCFGYEAVAGNKPTTQVLDTAAALELTHSALLIHDDIIDNDDFRRGGSSLHNQYMKKGNEKGVDGAAMFGVNMALCGGDMCLFFAFELLTEVPKSVCSLFTSLLVEVCEGQMRDVYLQTRPSVSKQSIYELMKSKTAVYTVSLPLMAGALLAGGSPATLRKLRIIGDAVGTIYQIRDDELGVMGSSSKTGKPIGADIREGKKTLIYHYLLKKCSIPERRTLRVIFGNPSLTENDIVIVQKLIRKHRIQTLLNREVQTLANRALKTLEALELSAVHKTELESLIEFCAKRQA